MPKDPLLDALNEQLRFEGRVTRYLQVLRAGREPIVFPECRRERRALEVARDDFHEEVELLIQNGADNG